MIAGLTGVVVTAAAIPGWTAGEDAEAVALASFALPADAIIVEVGVFMGRCTVLLAGARRLRGNGKVHCIDPFDCSGDAFSVPYYESELRRSGAVDLHAAFLNHVAQAGLVPWIEVHRETAAQVAARWVKPADLVLLDGDQSRAGARLAYEAWLPHLKPGGTLILRNTRQRDYAEGHDGHWQLAREELTPPRFSAIRQVGATTIAVKDF